MWTLRATGEHALSCAILFWCIFQAHTLGRKKKGSEVQLQCLISPLAWTSLEGGKGFMILLLYLQVAILPFVLRVC